MGPNVSSWWNDAVMHVFSAWEQKANPHIQPGEQRYYKERYYLEHHAWFI